MADRIGGDRDTDAADQDKTGKEDTPRTQPSTAGNRKAGEGVNEPLLVGDLAMAVSGHWRTAELYFEETARQVKQTPSGLVPCNSLCCFQWWRLTFGKHGWHLDRDGSYHAVRIAKTTLSISSLPFSIFVDL